MLLRALIPVLILSATACSSASSSDAPQRKTTTAPNSESSGNVKKPNRGESSVVPANPRADQEKAVPYVYAVSDLSVLFPLTDADSLWTPNLAGDKGSLLPYEYFKDVPESMNESNSSRYGRTRLVALRFDPCFPVLLDNPLDCQAYVRMVWQSVSGSSTDDVAFHSFYKLTSGEWTEVLDTLKAMRAESGRPAAAEILSVQPELGSQGLNGFYGQSLKSLILRIAGRDNLSELAFMQRLEKGDHWVFGSLEVDGGGNRSPKAIPTLENQTKQSLVSQNFSDLQLSFEEGFASQGIKQLTSFFGDPTDEQKAAAARLRSLENPRTHNAGSVDCASCHVADLVRSELKNSAFPELANGNEIFASDTQNLRAAHQPRNGVNLRAFGYLGSEPAIAQRTINETAAIADYLNRQAAP